jgi:crotonobetainyl-CoA:carnitine CoA-transferase CaiB-like acyl-CoA transferase
VKNQAALAAEIAPAIQSKTTKECLNLFTDAGIPCGPIYDIGEALMDPQTQDRGMVIGYEHPKAGKVRNIGFPVKFSEIEVGVKQYPPRLGEHTYKILQSAGYSESHLKNLEEKGIIKQSSL